MNKKNKKGQSVRIDYPFVINLLFFAFAIFFYSHFIELARKEFFK